MKKYSNLAETIIANVGGKSNIIDLRHCATRLRFQLKDEQLANTEVLRSTEGIIAVLSNMGEYMVVIGEHVPYVYDEINERLGVTTSKPVVADKPKEKIFNRILNVLMAGLSPTLNMACASGIIKGITTILVTFGIVATDSGIYTILDGLGSALFFFLPMILGYNVAKKLEMDPNIGFLIGAILCYPSLNGTDINLFGYVINATYTSTFLPVIIVVALAAPLDKFLRKHIPELVRNFIAPAIVLAIIVPLGFALIGPAANALGAGVSNLFNMLLELNKWIAGPLFAGFWQVLVLMGIHGTIMIVPFMELMQGVPSQILALTFITTFAQIGAVLAVYLKTKNKKLKSVALPAFISGIFGVTEPAIYGVSLPNIKVFICSCIGSAVSGLIVVLLNAIEYYYSGLGVFGLLGFMNPNNPSMIPILVSIISGFVVSFVLVYVTFKDKEDSQEIEEKNSDEEIKKEKKLVEETIYSPMKGKVVSLSESKDAAFSSEVLGKGLVIYPEIGKVVAPCDGVVRTLFPTKHAIGIVSNKGCEILIHIGYNTINLEGKYFTTYVKQDDHVKKGDTLVKFDIDKITKLGFSVETPVIVTNTNDYSEIEVLNKDELILGEEVLIVR